MQRKRIALVGVALAGSWFLWSAPAQNDDRAEVLLEAARKKAVLEGDLETAIKQCKEIVANDGGNRAVAASALVQMGEWYEKLGDAEARKAYERVVREYADQAEPLKEARARLTALEALSAQAAAKPRFRKVGFPFKLSWSMPDGVFGAALSPNGKAFALSSEGAIWVVPVEGQVSPEIAGVPQRLTAAMRVGDGFAWSADGNWIAFNLMTDKEGGQDIYVVSSRGGEPKRVAYRRSPAGLAIGPVDTRRLGLSPDGQVLAFTSVGERENLCVATVLVDGGVPRCVADAGSGDPAFSPDGRHVAYIQALDGRRHELRVIPAGGGRSAVVTEIRDRARSPVWSPDGRYIAFLVLSASFNDTEELRIAPVSDEGMATGSPTSIKLPWRTNCPLVGWGADNRIGFQFMNPRRNAIYTVPASGGNATQVTPEGEFHFPRWTPDGKTIWVLNGNLGKALGYVPSSGGTVTTIRTDPVQPMPPGGGNVVSPDGKTVVFAGGIIAEGANSVQLWTMPVKGGQPAQLTKAVNPAVLQDRFPCWAPDGKSVLFIRSEGWRIGRYASINIYVVPAEGGDARPITSASDKVVWGGIACSPDGKWVAYFSQDAIARATSAAGTIKIKPLDGGEAKVVAKVDHVGGHEEISWSPDGRKLAYNAKGKVWVVSLEGGEPVAVQTGLGGNQLHVAWSPDGDRVAFQGFRGGEPELWLMEDFPDLVKTGR